MILSEHIDDDVEGASEVPGDIALQAGGKSARRELSLLQSKCQTNDQKEDLQKKIKKCLCQLE